MASRATLRCLNCREPFIPDRYNEWHQEYCTKPACRRASRAESQRRWLAKNPDYYRGEANCVRVRTWRAAHPGYWRRRPRRARRARRGGALQDLGSAQPPDPQLPVAFPFGSSPGLDDLVSCVTVRVRDALTPALQDLAFSQHLAVAALCGHLDDPGSGWPLQDIIGTGLRRLYRRAERALGVGPGAISPEAQPP